MKIHEQANFYKNKAEFLEGELIRLRSYVSSEKFSVDTSCNTADIQLRINESLNDLYKEFSE